jgi:hypothetical protein
MFQQLNEPAFPTFSFPPSTNGVRLRISHTIMLRCADVKKSPGILSMNLKTGGRCYKFVAKEIGAFLNLNTAKVSRNFIITCFKRQIFAQSGKNRQKFWSYHCRPPENAKFSPKIGKNRQKFWS